MMPTEMGETLELMYQTGWTDGLPVVPPIWDRVKQFIECVGSSAHETVKERVFASRTGLSRR